MHRGRAAGLCALGLLIYGENEIKLEGEYISITGTDNYGIYGSDYNGFSGNIFDFDADTDLTINGGTFGGRFADGNNVTFSAGNSLTLSGGDYGGYFSGGNSVKLSAGNSLLLSGGSYGIAYLGNDGGERETPKIYAPFVSFTGTNTYGLYVKDADMFVRGSETERATQITSTGGRYGVRAFDDASAELYAEKISISGGECGVMADGSDGDGGRVTLSAPVVVVSAADDGSSIYTDENGSVTAGDKGALVQLTGCVKSGYSSDDGTMDKTSGGTAVLNLDAAGSFLKGQSYDVDWDSNARDVKGVTMNLGDGAYWSFSGESTMRFLNGSGGEVRMQNGTTGDKANIGSLSGKGSFLLDTDIDADKADSVFAKTGSGAEYGVLVENSGSDPNRERMNQYLVKTEDKGGTFSLLNRDGKVEAGIYSYSLASEEVRDGKEWYLMRSDLMPEPEPDPEPTPGTDPDEPTTAPDPGTEPDEPAPAPDAPITADELSSTAQAALGSIVSPFIWYIEVDSLYKRIDEYTPDYEGGAWFRAFGKKEYYDNGLVDGVKQEYGGMSAGYDWVKAYDDGAKLYYGFMLGYGEGEREISFGSNDFDSKHFSLYGIYKKPNKFYVAGILKYSRYGSDFDLTESAYRRVEGDFDQNGYGASVQVGREFSLGNGWFWEPQLQFSVLRIEGDSYRTSGSPNAIIDVDMGDTDSVRLRGGLVLGREIINDDGSKFRGYVKASIQHEFDEKTDIWLDRRLFVSDLSGTWGSYGLGLQYRAKHGQSLFFDFEYGCGEKREQPWAVQLGYRIEM